MIDGKVCNALTDTASSQRCYICQASSKQFNDTDEILNSNINEANLSFGISSLHAWIRLFECCSHLSYKLHLQKWQVRGEEEKEKVKNERKLHRKVFA